MSLQRGVTAHCNFVSCQQAPKDASSSLVPSLQYGQWVLSRLVGATQCAAKDGTVEMETEDGSMELFQCPGELEKGEATFWRIGG